MIEKKSYKSYEITNLGYAGFYLEHRTIFAKESYDFADSFSVTLCWLHFIDLCVHLEKIP